MGKFLFAGHWLYWNDCIDWMTFVGWVFSSIDWIPGEWSNALGRFRNVWWVDASIESKVITGMDRLKDW